MTEPPEEFRIVVRPDDAGPGPVGLFVERPPADEDQRSDNQDEQQVRHGQTSFGCEYTRVGRLDVVTNDSDRPTVGATGPMLRDVVVYTLARLVLVVALTAAIFFGAQLIGIKEFPLVVALLFAFVLALPLGIWLLGPLRRRATAGIAEVDERRRRDREQLRARLRGEEK